MDDERPQSARFWRFNSLQALQGVNLDEKMAVDPDDLAEIKTMKAEKAGLIEREKAVKARYNRLMTNRQRPQND